MSSLLQSLGVGRRIIESAPERCEWRLEVSKILKARGSNFQVSYAEPEWWVSRLRSCLHRDVSQSFLASTRWLFLIWSSSQSQAFRWAHSGRDRRRFTTTRGGIHEAQNRFSGG